MSKQEPITVSFTRIIDAPRELVYKAWTDPKQFARWWGPRRFSNPVVELDVRPGGALLVHMQGPDKNVMPMKGNFIEVVPSEKLVFTTLAFEDANGKHMLEAVVTVTFEEVNGKTKLTVRDDVKYAAPEIAGAIAGMEQGWKETLDRFEESLSGEVKG